MHLSSVSGLQAANVLLATAADNTANMLTPGHRSTRADLTAAPGGGVRSTVRQADAPGVDLAGEVVTTVLAGLMYAANAQMLRTSDELRRALLDVAA